MKKTKTLLLILWISFIFSFSFAYTTEEIEAYNYAFANWITTVDSIEKADMWWNLTRIAMAKMLSNYAINILWLNVNTGKACYFPDVSSGLNAQYDNWVTKACQLGLMWVWIDLFYPYWKVTRAEFWTVLSRALNVNDVSYLNKLNNSIPFYYEHLKFLNKVWIMNNISNPNNFELRWRVMLMLMRANDTFAPNNSQNIQNTWNTQGSGKLFYIISKDSDNRIYDIEKSGIIYKNYAHGIQIDFGNIWSWAYLMTSNKKIDMTFSGVSVADITMFTYDEYEDAILLSHDNVLCDENCFKDSIIWHNNTYYFKLNTSNMAHEELKALIPALQCSERVVWNTVWVACDWYEEVNWKLVKTWKDWVEQLFPEWCFEFFNPEL